MSARLYKKEAIPLNVLSSLHNDPTEDPQFLKYQFPPFFLCPTCHAGGQFSRRKVRNFLLRYYVNIRPSHRVHSRRQV
jgi:hypothetical protein